MNFFDGSGHAIQRFKVSWMNIRLIPITDCMSLGRYLDKTCTLWLTLLLRLWKNFTYLFKVSFWLRCVNKTELAAKLRSCPVHGVKFQAFIPPS